MEHLFKCKSLNKSYSNIPVITDLNLTLERGKILGLLGPNGSGKTTLIKILTGLLTPNGGDVEILGNPIGAESKKVISYLPDKDFLPKDDTVATLLKFYESFYKNFNRSRALEMLMNLEIDQKAKLKHLSKGTREKVALILVMSRDADLYLLDEPIAGVDPAARDYILNTILSNYNDQASIIISTHLISDVEQILSDVVFIKNGNIVLQGDCDEIRNSHGNSIDGLFREVFKC